MSDVQVTIVKDETAVLEVSAVAREDWLRGLRVAAAKRGLPLDVFLRLRLTGAA